MYNFCTLFDSHYLSRGIALYQSLERVCDSAFHLYIFAFDERAESVLRTMKLKHATIISLREFEDVRLIEVKPLRTRAEYCWTATSSTILYVLNTYQVDACTYLDADMMFFSSPASIFEELGDASILLTEHRYSPQYDKELLTGRYCVQFVTFKNNEKGRRALTWWRDRCIEWCYARFEDGKFGDQKYLDDWSTRFDGVHVLEHLGGGVAAWNVQQYHFNEEHGTLMGREIRSGKTFPVIFYHYHYLRFYSGGRIELGRRKLSENVLSYLYVPYLKVLQDTYTMIRNIDATFDPHGTSDLPLTWKTPILFLYRHLFGIYNIFPLSTFLVRQKR